MTVVTTREPSLYTTSMNGCWSVEGTLKGTAARCLEKKSSRVRKYRIVASEVRGC